MEGKVAELETQLKDAEAKQKELHDLIDKAALNATQEKGQLQSVIKAQETRLLHQALSEIAVSPTAPQVDGWLLVEGHRTYTLQGHSGAKRVRFYFADVTNRPESHRLAGEDTTPADGWTWTGAFPVVPPPQYAFWAEAEYDGGVIVRSAVLPIAYPGK